MEYLWKEFHKSKEKRCAECGTFEKTSFGKMGQKLFRNNCKIIMRNVPNWRNAAL